MGNCLETHIQRRQQQEEKEEEEDQQGCVRERASGLVQESGFKQGGIRVKIVITKEELQWFMLQLKDKEGKRPLEDVFREIERGRGRGRGRVIEGWKPSLESIVESPEVLEMDR